jgi:hypothetical protein
MKRYFAFLDGERGACGAAFPDCPGCTAMGAHAFMNFNCHGQHI